MSNLFEILVVSSKDKRFNEWIKCFELLFDVTADQIMADYNELIPLANVTINTYQRTYDNYSIYNYDASIMMIYNHEPYDWITVSSNRNRFFTCLIVI